MKQTKRKNKIKTKSRARTKQYPPHYLAIVLIVFLLLQGFLMSVTQLSDWQAASGLLDVYPRIVEVSTDLGLGFQPVLDLFDSVTTFYQMAATEMIALLADTNLVGEVVSVASAVDDFYVQASVQLTRFLDASEAVSWSAQVAGISI